MRYLILFSFLSVGGAVSELNPREDVIAYLDGIRELQGIKGAMTEVHINVDGFYNTAEIVVSGPEVDQKLYLAKNLQQFQVYCPVWRWFGIDDVFKTDAYEIHFKLHCRSVFWVWLVYVVTPVIVICLIICVFAIIGASCWACFWKWYYACRSQPQTTSS